MDAPRFSDLARLLHALDARQSEKPPTQASRSAMLRAFFQRYLPTGTDTCTVCAVFALLLPAEDDRRYHLKESSLAKAVVAALGLGGSSAAQRLLELAGRQLLIERLPVARCAQLTRIYKNKTRSMAATKLVSLTGA